MSIEFVSKLLEGYDYDNITIGVLGSHSALDVLDGAKRMGFQTIVILQEGREEPYSRMSRIIDESIVLENYSDIFTVQEELREKNTIFIPNRSFAVYSGVERIENEFMIPLFGSRNLLKTEEIEEFVTGVPFNFNFFYSPMYQRVELMGIDKRFVTDLDGIARLPAYQQLKLEMEEEMKEIGNYAVTLRESMLRYVYPMADRFVDATRQFYPPGIIGPFALQTMITKDYEFVVFDVSMRMGGGTNSFMGIGSQYSAVYWGEPVSAGKRVSMEIKNAIQQNRLPYILT
jgi:5-formaminoimidazole-4-carboxamide-1-beta-D-ribofuranosyl 5'-monophosphate synthetase